MIKNLNTNNVLKEITKFQNALIQARRKKKDFKKIHEKLLVFCSLILKKVDYKSIDANYPEVFIININYVNPGNKKIVSTKKIVINDGKSKWSLLNEDLKILKKTKAVFTMRKKIE